MDNTVLTLLHPLGLPVRLGSLREHARDGPLADGTALVGAAVAEGPITTMQPEDLDHSSVRPEHDAGVRYLRLVQRYLSSVVFLDQFELHYLSRGPKKRRAFSPMIFFLTSGVELIAQQFRGRVEVVVRPVGGEESRSPVLR